MTPTLGRLIGAGVLAATAIATPVQARQVASKDGLTAFTSNRPDWCQSTVELIVKGDNREPFTGDRVSLQRLLLDARFTIEDECPSADRIEVQGFVGSTRVFTGIAAKASGWGVAEVVSPTAPQVAQASPPAATPVPQPPSPPVAAATAAPTRQAALESSIQQCDRLAAHADDPEAFAPGVSDGKLSPQAIAACEAAIKQNRNAPRLAFQLARAYLQANRFEDATEQLLAAAKQGHGGALAYLADLHVDGAPGIEADPILARSLYQRAIASGFQPAIAVLAQFEDYTAQAEAADLEEKELLAQEKAAEKINASPSNQAKKYINPDIVNPVLSGNLDAVPFNEIYVKQYLLNMAENISEMCEGNHFTKREISQLKLDFSMGSVDMSTGGGVQAGMGALMNMLTGLQNPGAHIQRQAQASIDQEHLPEEAMKDAFALMGRHPCNSAQLGQFSKNLASFIKNEGAPRVDADTMLNICRRNSGFVRAQDANGFCMCFLAASSNGGMSRRDRKEMATNFNEVSTRLMGNDRQRFGHCAR